MADEAPRIAHIAETGDTRFSISIDVSGFALEGDEPLDMGGGNKAPSPYDYLLAALGSCTVMTMRWYAHQKNWPLDRAEATISHEKRNGQDVFIKKLRVYGDTLTSEQHTKLLEVAAKCPVQKTLTSDIIVETYWEE